MFIVLYHIQYILFIRKALIDNQLDDVMINF